MNIKLLYNSINEKNVNITFFDDDTKEIAGQCNYYIENNIGYIYNTYLFPEYRNKKIMKTYINDIISHIKSNKIEKVLLHTYSDETSSIWQKLGFKKTYKNNMELTFT